ncbi:MAG: rubrerythrin family protein [Methanomassiliicoccales archaeon]|nr:MAG: rubrerythrin family protein [Methanomassiliicoccales archaeon]
MSKTVEDLKSAFAGESQANRKYLAFAVKAEEEGFPEVAKLFRAAAESETIHAMYHLRAMGGVGTTADNLREAIGGENYEHTTMYPAMILHAKAEGNKVAETGFTWANTVEKTHEGLYEKALGAVKEKKDLPKRKLWVCQVCGHVHEGDEPPEKCPVCNNPKKKFKEAV